jgi:hypothetical protein
MRKVSARNLKRGARGCLSLALLLLAPAVAAAQAEGNPPNWCRNGAFTDDSEHFRLARVKGARGDRAYFHRDDDDDCPQAGARCRGKAYVIPGDELIVSRTLGAWACAWYQPRRGSETVGWVEASRLDISEAEARPALADWLGEWTFYENFVRIRRGPRAGQLAVEGQAYWRGLGDNVHVGEIGGEVAPAGQTLALEDDTCRVGLRLLGPYLLVDDNNQCGGVNVSFDGVYTKRIKR